MLLTCGQIIGGVQEFCDHCWECSARCPQCDDWFNKDQVSPVTGLCTNCTHEAVHEIECENGHVTKMKGILAQCPECFSWKISPTNDDPFVYAAIADAQEKRIRELESTPLRTPLIMAEL